MLTPEPPAADVVLTSQSEDEASCGVDNMILTKDFGNDELDFLGHPQIPKSSIQILRDEKRKSSSQSSSHSVDPLSLFSPKVHQGRNGLDSHPIGPNWLEDRLRRSVSPIGSAANSSMQSSSPFTATSPPSLQSTETSAISSLGVPWTLPNNSDAETESSDRIVMPDSAEPSHGRYTLRTRQAKQVNPYAYDKLLYKRQMRSNPDAIVKVVSPPRPRGVKHHGEHETSEEEYTEDEVALEEEARRKRKDKSRSRSAHLADSEARLRQDGQEGTGASHRYNEVADEPFWEPAAFAELSSSSDGSSGDDLLLELPEVRSGPGIDQQRSRFKPKPFPVRMRRSVPAEVDEARVTRVSQFGFSMFFPGVNLLILKTEENTTESFRVIFRIERRYIRPPDVNGLKLSFSSV